MKKYFENIMDVYDILSEDNKKRFQLFEITSQLISTNWNFKGKYPSLSQVIPRLGALNILKRFPDLLVNILSVIDSKIVVSPASNLYNQFVSLLYEEIKKEEEFKTICVIPIIDAISSHEEKSVSILQYIFPTIVKLDPTNLSFILNEMNSRYRKENEKKLTPEVRNNLTKYIKTILSILKSSKPLGVLNNELEDHVEMLELAFNHFDEDVKILALEILVLNPKTSESPTKLEFEMLKKFLSSNLNHCSSVFLSKINNSVMKKLFNQIKGSTYKSWKSIEQLKKESNKVKPKENPKKSTKETKEIIPESIKPQIIETPLVEKKGFFDFLGMNRDSTKTTPVIKKPSELETQQLNSSESLKETPEDFVSDSSPIYKSKVFAQKQFNFEELNETSLKKSISTPEPKSKDVTTKRVREDEHSIPNKKKKTEDSPELNNSQYADLLTLQCESCIKFLESLLEIIKINLYPGSPHDKKVFALTLYKMMIQTFMEEKGFHLVAPPSFKKKIYWKPLNLFPSEISNLLLNSFLDNFDRIREDVYQVLMLFPNPLSNEDEISSFISAANQLLDVGRLRESDSGALMIRLLYSKYILQSNQCIKELCEDNPKESNHFNFLKQLLNQLQRRTELCEKNLSNILENPLIGHVTVLKYCLTQLDSKSEEWKYLTTLFLSILFRIQRITSRVVSSIDDGETSLI
jgi:hypothetical protein